MNSATGIAFFPASASTMAPKVDAITFALLALCTLIALGLFAAVVYFCIRYRKGSSAPYRERAPARLRSRLELSWTLIPILLGALIFAWAARAYFELHVAPADAVDVYVVARQWMWKFQHPDGRREINELHVPVGTPIRLVMTSQDVIHSFFVPDFRVKQDVLPDRYTYTWFTATRPGQYHLFCSQYCGTDHAEMRGRVVALSPADYLRWQANSVEATASSGGPSPGGPSLVSQGAEAFRRFGCISCHGISVGAMAPDLNGVYGSQVRLSDGTTVMADENYLRESILVPNAKIVEGYKAIMPSFAGQANEQDLLALIAYIKSLRGLHP